MKTVNALRLTTGILIAVASINAWCQASEASGGQTGAAATAASGGTTQTARQANRALRKQIYAAIAQHREINAGNISVVAKSGAVTLNGTVRDSAQIDAVAEITKGVPGVTSVKSNLTVRRQFN
ncbi:BON domain-containing protein [Paraburkholderia sp. BL10I2N1]|uniref:BON domain-containing protein n=1 Tax=Paraburkholderia sp. BL10I2N1 TaxID=1938796 RepID=UPI00105E5215|nr:BON domain-containing protein [Paraburkholderia sp. BL10I2N1]TDN57795.1 BON domain-containing protein [Paraburkholderia sp. BL10I2N1]